MNKRAASKEYTSVNAQTGIVDADPHRLIQMLYSGLIEQIAIAKGCMQRNEIAGKGEAISKAIGIVNGLAGSVNHEIESGGLSDRLASLYEFATRKLTEANINNDEKALDEVLPVLKELQAGWNEIRPEVLAQAQREFTSA